MTLQDDIAADLASIYTTDDAGETVEWHPAVGDAITDIVALLNIAQDVDLGTIVGTTILGSCTVAAFGGRTPAARDEIRARGRKCRIAELEQDPVTSEYIFTLEVGAAV